MCMISRRDVNIPEASAFKLFTRNEKGQLQSPFSISYKRALHYPPNERIRVDDEDACFFAFQDKGHAMSFAFGARRPWYGDDGIRRKWLIVRGRLIVLPVTLFDVVGEGMFHVPSGDVQCLDGYYPVLESKEILVHVTEDTQNGFHDEILRRFFRDKSYSMSGVEKEAIRARIPHVAGYLEG